MNENYLKHAIFLKSDFGDYDYNMDVLLKLLNYIDFNVCNRNIVMDDVEKVIYHYIMNDFSKSPYTNFDCAYYQNTDQSNSPLEEIKFLICKACDYETSFFNSDIDIKHKNFNNKFKIIKRSEL